MVKLRSFPPALAGRYPGQSSRPGTLRCPAIVHLDPARHATVRSLHGGITEKPGTEFPWGGIGPDSNDYMPGAGISYRQQTMSLVPSRNPPAAPAPSAAEKVRQECADLATAQTRGELGSKIALLVLRHSPEDIQQMTRNFGKKVRDLSPEYRNQLTRKINEHLLGTYQAIRLRNQQGSFTSMTDPLTPHQRSYWEMVAGQCASGDDGSIRLRFLNYLLAAFCMMVGQEPGHPAGTPFPGGDTVQLIDGVWYCPVREKAGDVDAALCPFCPALQTPGIGYLRPPVNGSGHRKQEFIDHMHRHHHFNG